MAKITIIIEDKPDGAAVDFYGDLPEQGARNLTAAQKTLTRAARFAAFKTPFKQEIKPCWKKTKNC